MASEKDRNLWFMLAIARIWCDIGIFYFEPQPHWPTMLRNDEIPENLRSLVSEYNLYVSLVSGEYLIGSKIPVRFIGYLKKDSYTEEDVKRLEQKIAESLMDWMF